MSRKTGHDRRLRWGDGWIVPRTTANGEARYQARRRQADGRVVSATFASERDAEAFLRDAADRDAAGGYVPPERITVAQLLDAFLARAAHRVTPGTLGQWQSRARSLVCPVLGDVPLSGLAAPRVQHWIDGLVKRGLSAETIVGGRRLLAAACAEAVVLGMVATNPVTGTRAPAVRQRPPPVWTEEEIAVVLAVASADPMLECAYRVALSTGVRPGELLALRWSDVDLARGRLTVARTRTLDDRYKEIEGETTKGKRRRAIALLPSTVAALKAWKRAQAELRLAAPSWADPEMVLTDGEGRRVRREHWARIHAGIVVVAGATRITPHGMRHTFATRALERGMPLQVVSNILGHKTTAFTADRYQHVDPRMQETAMAAMADLFGAEGVG